MPKFQAIINTPGYLPMDDESHVFDTAREAWQYLAGERQREEDQFPEWPAGNGEGNYSDTYDALARIASLHHDCLLCSVDLSGYLDGDPVTYADGTGTVYGNTPGYEGSHDPGMAYSVVIVDA